MARCYPATRAHFRALPGTSGQIGNFRALPGTSGHMEKFRALQAHLGRKVPGTSGAVPGKPKNRTNRGKNYRKTFEKARRESPSAPSPHCALLRLGAPRSSSLRAEQAGLGSQRHFTKS